MNQASQVAEHFLLQSPKWKSDYQNQNKDYIDDEASALYHSIVEGLSRLRDKEEIYLVIFEQKGRVLVNHKRRGNRLMAVEKGIERLLKIMMEKECFGNAEDGGEGAPGEDRKVKIESSGEGEDVGAAGSYKCMFLRARSHCFFFRSYSRFLMTDANSFT